MRRKFIPLNASNGKEERSQIKSLLQLHKKKKQNKINKPKANRWKEIIKIRQKSVKLKTGKQFWRCGGGGTNLFFGWKKSGNLENL